jgi:predicted RNase H-like HicB family nuclease
MKQQFTAVYKKRGEYYIGWVEEIPGVNTQGKNRSEVKENLREALALIFETNRLLTKKENGRCIIREPITIST